MARKPMKGDEGSSESSSLHPESQSKKKKKIPNSDVIREKKMSHGPRNDEVMW